MTQNSVQHRERIFVKGYGFLSFAKNIGKNITKNLKYSQETWSATDALKTSSKRVIQKQENQLMIWLVIKLLMKLRKSEKRYHKIIQKQLQINMIKKYLNKDIYISRRKTGNYW